MYKAFISKASEFIFLTSLLSQHTRYLLKLLGSVTGEIGIKSISSYKKLILLQRDLQSSPFNT